MHESQILQAFAQTQHGEALALELIHMALKESPADTRSKSLSYWTNFVFICLKEIYTVSSADNQNNVIELPAALIKKFLSSHPYAPMSLDACLLDEEFLNKLAAWLFLAVKNAAQEAKQSIKEWLEERFPEWKDIGLIHFHLAESKDERGFVFPFLATYTTRLSDKSRLQHQSLAHLLLHKETSSQKIKIITESLKDIADEAPFFQSLLNSNRFLGPCAFSAKEAFDFLQEAELYKKMGVIINLPKSWQNKAPSKAKVEILVQKQDEKSFVGFDAMFRFHIDVAVDGLLLTEDELKKILESSSGLIMIQGKWVQADTEQIKGLLNQWRKASALAHEGYTFSQVMRFLSRSHELAPKSQFDIPSISKKAEEWLNINPDKETLELLKSLSEPSTIDFATIAPIIDAHLKAQLRSYQKDGLMWLYTLARLGFGGCLADDMGLGKTIQILGLLVLCQKALKAAAPSLLVVPASLIGNWQRELSRFCPEIRYKVLHSSAFGLPIYLSNEKDIYETDLLITTYGMTLTKDWLQKIEWNLLIIDEAQAIKNHGTKQSLTLKKFYGKSRFALTGTPIENSVSDLWSLFDFCCPDLLGTFAQFKSYYDKQKEQKDYTQLKQLIAPYILRRKKTDKKVIDDLPEKIEMKTFCLLSETQIDLYKKTVKSLSEELKIKTEGIERKGLILSYLLKFKQICNHPSQMLSNQDYSPQDSGKFLYLKDLCSMIHQAGEKVLIFTQFKEITDILNDLLKSVFGKKGFVLHGGIPVIKRQEMVQDFQSQIGSSYFILSLKAGGSGLNLTAASHVVHFDRWWNPAVENQATDRAFRIGQKNRVIVHKFICRGTIEEQIDQMIENKSDLAFNLIEQDSSQLRLTEMKDDELIALIAGPSMEKVS